MHNINPFDILSGKVVQTDEGTFWFKEPMPAGGNMQSNGQPIYKNLHRDNGLPAVIYKSGFMSWWVNGRKHRLDGPAATDNDGYNDWFVNGKYYSEARYNKEINKIRNETNG